MLKDIFTSAVLDTFCLVMELLGYEVERGKAFLWPGEPDHVHLKIYRRDWRDEQAGRRYVGIDPAEHGHV